MFQAGAIYLSADSDKRLDFCKVMEGLLTAELGQPVVCCNTLRFAFYGGDLRFEKLRGGDVVLEVRENGTGVYALGFGVDDKTLAVFFDYALGVDCVV